MGVTADTIRNIVIDAGAVYINYGIGGERLLGATEGGNVFRIEREVREIEVDGVKGKTMGLRRIITENASIIANMKEMSPENLVAALAGSDSAEWTTATMYAEYLGDGLDASTETFTFDEEPIIGSEKFYIDGVPADWTRGVDYTIVGTTFETLENDTLTIGQELTTTYQYDTGAAATHDVIISDGEIELSDYLDNVAIVGTVTGSSDPVVCLIKNALGDEGLEMNFTDQDEVITELTFSAHYDPADLTLPIYEIRYPRT